MEDVLAILLIFGGGTLIMLSFSPVGKAIAERIRGRGVGPDPEVLNELEQVRGELVEVQERLDFAERMLSQRADAGQLGPRHEGDQA